MHENKMQISNRSCYRAPFVLNMAQIYLGIISYFPEIEFKRVMQKIINNLVQVFEFPNW